MVRLGIPMFTPAFVSSKDEVGATVTEEHGAAAVVLRHQAIKVSMQCRKIYTKIVLFCASWCIGGVARLLMQWQQVFGK